LDSITLGAFYVSVYKCMYILCYFLLGVEILGELAWCIDNADLLADLPQDVYDTIIMHTLLPDVEVS